MYHLKQVITYFRLDLKVLNTVERQLDDCRYDRYEPLYEDRVSSTLLRFTFHSRLIGKNNY